MSRATGVREIMRAALAGVLTASLVWGGVLAQVWAEGLDALGSSLEEGIVQEGQEDEVPAQEGESGKSSQDVTAEDQPLTSGLARARGVTEAVVTDEAPADETPEEKPAPVTEGGDDSGPGDE